MKREVQGNNNTSVTTGTTRYGFTDADSVMDFVLDGSGGLLQRVVSLPGGAVLTKNYGSSQGRNWSFPNIHGDILFTAGDNGVRTGKLHLYDPFGQDIDAATGVIGDIPIPETAQGGLDFGYLGQHKVPIEHVGSQQALEMGARTYLPALGRFLQTDPILAASANNYDYANGDPINSNDLTGKAPEFIENIARKAAGGRGVVGYVLDAVKIGSEYMDGEIDGGDAAWQLAGRWVGRTAGQRLGCAGGMAIGAIVAPEASVLTAPVGGIVGATVGGMVGATTGEDWQQRSKKKSTSRSSRARKFRS